MSESISIKAQAARLIGEGRGEAAISTALGITRHRARALVLELTKAQPGAAIATMEIEPQTSAEFAERIAACWRKSVEAIFEVGRLLSSAKERLVHGEFEIMIEGALPFGARTAQRLMAIARDERLTKPTHVSLLPPSWGTLYELTKLPNETFEARIADGTIRPDMERRDVSATVKTERRAARETHLGTMQEAGNLRLPEKKYGVILADPEWRFEVWSPAGLDRSADNHYATSETAKIAARPVQDIAAKDCVLFLWATAPMLPHALHVMAAWGFDYKSHAIWDKGASGTGYWFRNCHELLLVGTRGNVVAPSPGTQPPSIHKALRGEHSVKPIFFHIQIAEWFPHLPKIELNARRSREGWDTWGLEAPNSDDRMGDAQGRPLPETNPSEAAE